MLTFRLVFNAILVGQRAFREFSPEEENQTLLSFEVVSRETEVGGTLGRRICCLCLQHKTKSARIFFSVV